MEIINLEDGNLSSEDELFFSHIATNDILILCIGNTCRSIIYESLLNNELKGENYKIYSAGAKVSQLFISKKTIEILNENNILVSKNNPDRLSTFMDKNFDTIILLDKELENIDLPYSRSIIKSYIVDPFNKSTKDYKETFNEISNLIENKNY